MRNLHAVISIAGAAMLASCGSAGKEQASQPSAAATTPEPDPAAMSFLPRVIRASGTEPLIRVMVEGEDAQSVGRHAEELAAAVRAAAPPA